MPRYDVTVDGQPMQIDADTPELAAKKAYARSLATQRRAPAPRMSFEDFDAMMRQPAPAPTVAPSFEQFDAEMRGGAPANTGSANAALMPRYVEGPNGQVVEFPAGTSDNVIEVQMRRAFGGPQQEGVGSILMRNLTAAPGRMVRAITEDVGKVGEVARSFIPGERGVSPAQTAALTTALRMGPALAPPLISAPLSAAGEAAAQGIEMHAGQREEFSPGQVGLAAAMPPAAATLVRAARGVGRMATRAVPSLFQSAQGEAQQAGRAMIQELRPTANVGQLAQGVEAASGDLIPMAQTTKIANSIRLPAEPANPASEAVQKTLGNIRGALKPSGEIQLGDLEAIRQDIGPLVGRRGADRNLKVLYSGLVRDLEVAGQSGSPGAAMARDMATAFKQEAGAARLGQLFSKATPATTASGGKALNVATLERLVENDRDYLTRQLGPEALNVVDAFVERFRGLPPVTAYTGWNSLTHGVLSLGGAGVGAALGGPAGAVGGATAGLGVELARNMAMAGRNPAVLNQLLTTAMQGARAAVTQGAWPAAGPPTADQLLGLSP